MQQAQVLLSFEQQIKTISEQMKVNPPNQYINKLKQLQKEINSHIEQHPNDNHDRLIQFQITIYNNLAYLYEKKNKYKSSLFHLQLAEQIENKYYSNKYKDMNMPVEALHKLSTTYSNLSAIQSKLRYYDQALLNIKFAIQVFNKSPQAKQNRGLIYLSYNYSFLLQANHKYREAYETAKQGLKLSSKYDEPEMVGKFSDLLKNLTTKFAKMEIRKQRQFKKYLKGQTGIVKKIGQLQRSKSLYTTIRKQHAIIQQIKDSNENNGKQNKKRGLSGYNRKYQIYQNKNSTNISFTKTKYKSNHDLNTKSFVGTNNYIKYQKKVPFLKDNTNGNLASLESNRVKQQTFNYNEDNLCFPVVHTDQHLLYRHGLLNKTNMRNYIKVKQQKPYMKRINATRKRLQQQITFLNKKTQVLEDLLQKMVPKDLQK